MRLGLGLGLVNGAVRRTTLLTYVCGVSVRVRKMEFFYQDGDEVGVKVRVTVSELSGLALGLGLVLEEVFVLGLGFGLGEF